MAKVGVEMPGMAELPVLIRACAVVALGVAVEETVTAIKASGAVPVNTGTGRRSLSAIPVTYRGGFLVSGVQAVGLGAEYMPTMEDGRRAGASGPSYRHLLFAPGFRDAKTTDEGAQRGGWVNRRMKDKVDALATQLQAKAQGNRKTKGKSKTNKAAFRQQARFLLARAAAQRIHRVGIAPRGFAHAQVGFLGAQFSLRFAEQLRLKGVA